MPITRTDNHAISDDLVSVVQRHGDAIPEVKERIARQKERVISAVLVLKNRCNVTGFVDLAQITCNNKPFVHNVRDGTVLPDKPSSAVLLMALGISCGLISASVFWGDRRSSAFWLAGHTERSSDNAWHKTTVIAVIASSTPQRLRLSRWPIPLRIRCQEALMRVFLIAVVMFAVVGNGFAESASASAAPELHDIRTEIQVVFERHQLIKVDVGRDRALAKGYVGSFGDEEFDLLSLDGHRWRIAYADVRALVNPVTGDPIAVHESSAKPVIRTVATIAAIVGVWAFLHALMQPIP